MNREEIVSILENKGFVGQEKEDYFGNAFVQYTAKDSCTVCVNETSLYLTVSPVIDIDDVCVAVRIYFDGADGVYLGGLSFVFEEIEYFDIEE